MVEMGQIKVFVQELGLKQGFLADTNIDLTTFTFMGLADSNYGMILDCDLYLYLLRTALEVVFPASAGTQSCEQGRHSSHFVHSPLTAKYCHVPPAVVVHQPIN